MRDEIIRAIGADIADLPSNTANVRELENLRDALKTAGRCAENLVLGTFGGDYSIFQDLADVVDSRRAELAKIVIASEKQFGRSFKSK